MQKGIFSSVLLLLMLFQIKAQKTSEIGLVLGRSYYLGEINPATHYGNGVGNFSWGALFRYNLNGRYSLKATYLRTTLEGSDAATDLPFNQARNANFETKLSEFGANIEFNFFHYKIGDRNSRFSPYLFTGIAYYIYNPSTSINDIPVVTSETDKENAFALSFGPGFKLNVGRKMSLNFEWGFRKTGNDVIDGLPNRRFELLEQGKSYDNDWYVMSGFMLTYKITDEGSCPVQNNF